MAKLALGKGMKDLLPKKSGGGMVQKLQKKETDLEALKDELKVNMDRFHAQGYNVGPLRELFDKNAKEIREGIENYVTNVKTLNIAHTHLKSIEGFGYRNEIDTIMESIKDPEKADEVLRESENLKNRALTEHRTDKEMPDPVEEEISGEAKPVQDIPVGITASPEPVDEASVSQEPSEPQTAEAVTGVEKTENEPADGGGTAPAGEGPAVDPVRQPASCHLPLTLRKDRHAADVKTGLRFRVDFIDVLPPRSAGTYESKPRVIPDLFSNVFFFRRGHHGSSQHAGCGPFGRRVSRGFQ